MEHKSGKGSTIGSDGLDASRTTAQQTEKLIGSGLLPKNKGGNLKMETQEVERKVAEDLIEESVLKDEIEQYLIPPQKVSFMDLQGEETELWIVLKKNEYLLAFDETYGDYGIGYRNITDELVYSGHEGSIYEAYGRLINR
ncbi:hypothetical protein CHISP_3708 [Chitinispirillum alkaliphilum]|nr:hypothetical protein CHISP_3708 [Chitinispirillum alkaliphilum]